MTMIHLNKESNYKLEQIGGKAFNLQRLIKYGLDVPTTYVVDVSTTKKILNGEINISYFLDYLPNTLYAVRSSGVNEDGQIHSFAGLFDSYLNVNKMDLEQSLKECALSVQNKRVDSYTKNLSLLSNLNIAIIIQDMIDCQYSGVCFTADPIIIDRSTMIFEIGEGLGDKIVSGEISPLTISVRKNNLSSAVKGYGDYNEFFAREFQKYLNLLFEKCLLIEKFYKNPVDIEWCISNGQIKILQTRPITNMQRVNAFN